MLALAGVLHFVVGRYGNFRAAQAIGANLVGPVIQLGLAVTLTLAVLVLKEPLTPLRHPRHRAAGARAGADAQCRLPTPMQRRQRGRGLPKFLPRYAEGYTFALMAALVYGVTPLLIRLAVIGGDLGSGIAGGLISYAPPRRRSRCCCCGRASCAMRCAIRPESLKWFSYSGVSV